MRAFEIFFAVNDEGDAAVSLEDASTAREALVDDYGSARIRVVKLTASMELPEVAEVEIEIPNEVGKTEPVQIKAA
jgi:hypothetical protein